MNVTVAQHLAEVRRLLHDPNDDFWSEADKITNINTAIRRRDADTGGNRTLVSLNLTASDGIYTLSDLGNTNVVDVVGIYVIDGGNRLLLNNVAFTVLNTEYRQSTTMTSLPTAWAKYTPTTIYLGPLPGRAYATEWDCCQVQGTALTSDQNDPLPYPFTEPVPYRAAFLCKVNQRAYAEAREFKEFYWDELRAIEAMKTGMLPTGYPVIGR